MQRAKEESSQLALTSSPLGAPRMDVHAALHGRECTNEKKSLQHPVGAASGFLSIAAAVTVAEAAKGSSPRRRGAENCFGFNAGATETAKQPRISRIYTKAFSFVSIREIRGCRGR
jgi:hypothetical protein